MRSEAKRRLIARYILIATAMLTSLVIFLLTSYPAVAQYGIWYDFEDGFTGWRINRYSEAITSIQQSSNRALVGNHSLEVLVDLRDQTGYDSGEVVVEFVGSKDLSGQTVVAWVYAPKGARGHPKLPNGIHLFVEDITGNKLYGTWKNMLEDGWFEISLPVTDKAPACGSMNEGFNPRAVKKMGINLGVGTSGGPAATYSGPIYIDAISSGTPDTLPSDHFYNFEDSNAQMRIPHWDTDPDFKAEAWDELHIDNGALVANALFDMSTDPTRKGFTQIIYSPYLNLAHKDHHIISFDIRFDPSAISPDSQCPFVATIFVWDDYKQKWFTSDFQHVGSGDWTSVTFNLDNPAEFAPGIQDYPGDMPTLTDIRRVGIQLFANTPYNGKIMFDNIVIGGTEFSDQYPSQNQGFVQTQGTQFMLNGEPFRFVGFNIEYLFTLREAEAETLLNAIQHLPGPKVIRVWGFSEGCESDEPNCAAWSRYFQPERGMFNETAFENFDRFIAMAGERGIRMIIALGNNWEEYGGIPQYMEWLQEECPDQIIVPSDIEPGTEVHTHTLQDTFFKSDCTRQWYKNYVKAFIGRVNRITNIRYADDPTIFAFNIINEPRSQSDVSGRLVHDWIKEMSDYIYNEFYKELDENPLIGTGAEGWYIMPGEDAQAFTSWQTFPKNNWHYGVNWRPNCDPKETYGSNGSDFISDHSSFDTMVRWQEYYGDGCKDAPIQMVLREGVPNVHYTSLHLYVAEHESNLYRAPYCAWGFTGSLCNNYNLNYFQAGEWLRQHVQDSHDVIGKPFIVAEFGLRKSETYQGAPGTYRQFIPVFTPEERRQLYSRYLQTMCELGVNGALVWNLGYDRFNDLIWDGVEALDADGDGNNDWQINKQNSDAVSIELNLDPQFVSWGSKSIKINYDPNKGKGLTVVERINIGENWAPTEDDQGRARIELDIYNPKNVTMTVAITLITRSDGAEYRSVPFEIQPGWNRVTANALLPYWNCSTTGCQIVENLDDVRQFNIALSGYNEAGAIYVDYVRHQGDDSLVIYPDEPIFETVLTEAQRWYNGCH